MKYVIKRVESKREKVNPWHGRVTGKVCTIESLEWGDCGRLLINGIVPLDDRYGGIPTLFNTSPIIKTEEKDGVLTIETKNSIYTLVMYESEKEENESE